MKRHLGLSIPLVGALLIFATQATGASYRSAETLATLLELYTSEGCSSCPPAERWLSRLKQDPRLWKTLFPVAFHVDYWDDLGWKDIFADAHYSDRQRTYAAFGYAGTVYTPGFFQNGREWRGWFGGRHLDADNTERAGVLSATVTSRQIDATFTRRASITAPRLNIAILGFDKTTHVEAGENRGKAIQHDFVALLLRQYPSDDGRWRITDPALLTRLDEGGAIVLWVTQSDDQTPIQTTGGWLTRE
jgi:hypothetical protein